MKLKNVVPPTIDTGVMDPNLCGECKHLINPIDANDTPACCLFDGMYIPGSPVAYRQDECRNVYQDVKP